MIAPLLFTNATLVISYALGIGLLEVRYNSAADDAVKTNRESISFRDYPKTDPVERNYWYSVFDLGHLAKLVTIPVYGETTNRCGLITAPTAFLKIAYTGDVCVAAWLADHVQDEQKTKGNKTK